MSGQLEIAEMPRTEWNPREAPPAGIRVEDLRRRGVDILRIHVTGPKAARSVVWSVLLPALPASAACAYLGAPVAAAAIVAAAVAFLLFWRRQGTEVSELGITRNILTLNTRIEGQPEAPAKHLAFTDVTNIAVRAASRLSPAALLITAHEEALPVGEGLPEPALIWLHNKLIMELAGLTWKSLHGVDRSRTRARSEIATNPLLLKPDLLSRLYTIFQSQSPDVLARLHEAVSAKDAAGIRQQAHWLKSASANIGMRHLSDLCQLMEIYGAEGDLDRTAVLLAGIAREHVQVMEGLSDAEAEAGQPAGAGSGAGLAATSAMVERLGAHDSDTPPLAGGPVLAGRVLVVDDSAVSREIAKEYLTDIVSQTVFANDGQAALELWEKEHFNLILMDCEMFGMDGYDCSSRLRQKETVRGSFRTPIVALTAHALKGDRVRCMAAGMDDYLSKPYAPEDLREKVEHWLNAPLVPCLLQPMDARIETSTAAEADKAA